MDGLEDCSSELKFCKSVGMTITEYDYDQLTADKARHVQMYGSSACSYIIAKQAPKFLCAGKIGETSRNRIATLVNEYDGKPCDGMFPYKVIKDTLNDARIPHKIVEGDPQNMLSEIMSAATLASAMCNLHEALVMSHSRSKIVFMITAEHSGSTGATMGAYVSAAPGLTEIHFEDPHHRIDCDGVELGMVTAHLHGQTPAYVYKALAEWICTWHLRKLGSKPPIQILGAVVDWRKRIEYCTLKDKTLRNLLALKPIISDPAMLPGDYLIDNFDGVSLIQLVVVGMKYFSIQKHLLMTYAAWGGRDLEENAEKLVQWLLD